MTEWEYDPVPRYFFFLGEYASGEVIFDGFKSDVCNGWDSNGGEVWRAISLDDGLIGRYSSLDKAKAAVRSYVLNRGLKLVSKQGI